MTRCGRWRGRRWSSTGTRCSEAAHPEAAVTLAQQHGGALDLLLTDVVMPG